MKPDLKFGFRLIVPTAMLVMLIGWLSGPFAGHLVYSWSINDLNLRARLVANSLGDDIMTELPVSQSEKVRRQFENLVKDERLYAMGFCDDKGKLTNASGKFFGDFRCAPSQDGLSNDGETLVLPSGKHFFVNRIAISNPVSGILVVIHDLAYVQLRTAETRRFIQAATWASIIVLAALILLVAKITRRLWIKGVRKNIVGWNTAERTKDFEPIVNDVKKLIFQLESERKVWNAESIQQLIKDHLNESEIFVVSNREPYIHHKNDDSSLALERPASGLVTALEPIVSVCKGTWIAHGSGSGDKDVVDSNDCIMVPPENPAFRLKRIWLTPEEIEGYYHGFSNEALWPLCLLTHTRPIFRTSDWEAYVKINQRFADAVIKECRTSAPLILVQDYHFSLLPRMIRDRLPDANIITFWHIPWPSPEIFNICPWKDELLDGLLGSQIIGFHTPAHVQNFLHSVQMSMESRVDFVHGEVHYKDAPSKIAAYPMSIEWQNADAPQTDSLAEVKKRILKDNNLPSSMKIGIGVDRLDYTKGILERFQAIERMIELNPDLRDKFCFIQIASPSRTEISAYKDYAEEVRQEAERINGRFGTNIPLIVLREFHHSKEELNDYYRIADLCFVSSLHDGMNLVAKEFVTARNDGKGVLVLSQFTGAAVGFPDALLVNPYHIDACANALARALYMHPEEQRNRMTAMRRQVRENNIFRWAGSILLDSAEIQRIRNIGSGNMRRSSATGFFKRRKL